MCTHVYQDTLHDFSPIGCLMKITPIYVFPVFTKHVTQMFRSGVHKQPTPDRPGDEISYKDAYRIWILSVVFASYHRLDA